MLLVLILMVLLLLMILLLLLQYQFLPFDNNPLCGGLRSGSRLGAAFAGLVTWHVRDGNRREPEFLVRAGRLGVFVASGMVGSMKREGSSYNLAKRDNRSLTKPLYISVKRSAMTRHSISTILQI